MAAATSKGRLPQTGRITLLTTAFPDLVATLNAGRLIPKITGNEDFLVKIGTFSSASTSHKLWYMQIEPVPVALFLISFGARSSISFIIKVKILFHTE